MDPASKRLVPIPEARHVLGDIGQTTIYELVKRGEITKVNIGSRSFITADSIEDYLEGLVSGAHGSTVTAEGVTVIPGDAGKVQE